MREKISNVFVAQPYLIVKMTGIFDAWLKKGKTEEEAFDLMVAEYLRSNNIEIDLFSKLLSENE
jgi:hypothetical protein